MTDRDERPPLAVVYPPFEPPDEPPFDPRYDVPAPRHSGSAGGRPPQDRLAEQAVLTTLVHTPELGETLASHLESEDFYWPVHAQIWDAWHHLAATDGIPPDAVTLNAHLVRTREADAVRALADLITGNPSPERAERHAELVRNAARLRVVDDLATGLHQLAATGAADQVDHTLAEALQRLDETVTRFGPSTGGNATGLVDLSWVLDGTPPVQPPPAFCRRADGTALFYAGKVNGVFGDPEHGKTWLAQIAVVEALNDGGTAAMIDVDHNGPDHTAARLLLLGARIEHIADPTRFRYYEPHEGDELLAAVTDITRLAPHVVLIDSLGEIFPMLGVNTNDGDEMTTAMRKVCTAPALAGSCVITIDHLPKSTEARSTGFAIGSIAKKRMIRGAYIRAEARQQPTPGKVGRITLRIEKDTVGELRKSSGGGYAGTLTLDSTLPHVTTWTIGQDVTPETGGSIRPTGLMERISRHIEDNDQCSFRDIKDAVSGKDKWLREAIRLLVDEGFVSILHGPRNSQRHHSIALYREAEDDQAQPTL